MKFLDQAKIFVQSGDGGSGCISLYRNRSMPFGIPDGGDGGAGGNVIFEVVPSLNTLIDFRFQQHFKAQRGRNGLSKNRHGTKGKDVILRVPQGTQIFDVTREYLLADLTQVGRRVTFLRGGNGGLGNVHDRSASHGTGHHSYGQKGTEQWVYLRLKLLADVGLVGLPNAGKSTFLTACTNATPKVADYPFTTVIPHLGIVVFDHSMSFVLADLPGLITGAHTDRGLGHRFLGHLEHTQVLLHLIDGTLDDIQEAYRTIRDEIKAYGQGLSNKVEVVAVTKCDIMDQKQKEHAYAFLQKITKSHPHIISAQTRIGLDPLLRQVVENLTLAGSTSNQHDGEPIHH